MNSVANEKGQNVAVNIWFKHTRNHRPQKCDIPEDEATIDKYKFKDLDKLKAQKKLDEEETVKEGEEGEESSLA